MYTSSIRPMAGYTYSQNSENAKAQQGAESASESGSSTQSRRFSGVASGGVPGDVFMQLRGALDGIEPDANGRITFKQVQEHKKALEEEFTAVVKADLRKLGVDEDINFRLVENPADGKVVVISDHPDKELVEKYLQANPDVVEQFQHIEKLGNLDRARSFQKTPITDIKQSLQTSAVEAFFSAAIDNGMGLYSQVMDLHASGYTSGMAGIQRRV